MKLAIVLLASLMSFSVAQAHDAEALRGEFRKIETVPSIPFDKRSDAKAPETLFVTIENSQLVIRKNRGDDFTSLSSDGRGGLDIDTLKEAIPLSLLKAARTELVDEGRTPDGVYFRMVTRGSMKSRLDTIMGSHLLVNVKLEQINDSGLLPKREKLVELDTLNGKALIVRIEGTTAAYERVR